MKHYVIEFPVDRGYDGAILDKVFKRGWKHPRGPVGEVLDHEVLGTLRQARTVRLDVHLKSEVYPDGYELKGPLCVKRGSEFWVNLGRLDVGLNRLGRPRAFKRAIAVGSSKRVGFTFGEFSVRYRVQGEKRVRTARYTQKTLRVYGTSFLPSAFEQSWMWADDSPE